MYIPGYTSGATYSTGIPAWRGVCCAVFPLPWSKSYSSSARKGLVLGARILDFGILLTLAFLYRCGDGEAINRFSTYWWGTLGLIGWSYRPVP